MPVPSFYLAICYKIAPVIFFYTSENVSHLGLGMCVWCVFQVKASIIREMCAATLCPPRLYSVSKLGKHIVILLQLPLSYCSCVNNHLLGIVTQPFYKAPIWGMFLGTTFALKFFPVHVFTLEMRISRQMSGDLSLVSAVLTLSTPDIGCLCLRVTLGFFYDSLLIIIRNGSISS